VHSPISKGINSAYGIGFIEGMVEYRNSLQEDPVFKVGDTIQKKDNNGIRYSIINKTSDGYRALRGLSDTIVIWFSEQDQWELVEEPVSEELEEEIKRWEESFKHCPASMDYKETAKHFFELGLRVQKGE
jgi:hypothetical protein